MENPEHLVRGRKGNADLFFTVTVMKNQVEGEREMDVEEEKRKERERRNRQHILKHMYTYLYI